MHTLERAYADSAMSEDPTCLFDCDAELIMALEAALGPPIDSYLNGWQVWVESTPVPGRGEIELEYRLHVPAGFTQPAGLSHHDLWDEVVHQLAEGRSELRLGEETRTLDRVWRLLEIYPAFGDPVAPDALRTAVETLLERPALATGYVDHARLGARWKRTKGAYDLAGELLRALDVEA